MTNRERNLRILYDKNYGLEEDESDSKLDLYSPKYLMVEQFSNHDELAAWIERNLNYDEPI